ncbi:hypothetical protein L1049_001153 [Liquidambar formosana]|uniref:DNA polymerase delta subunit 3 n=1 Tax=Liquidambar formosana TaxID=63359 RepID=A0AAP0NBU8_LIQFO
MNTDKQKEDKPKVKEEKVAHIESNQPLREESLVVESKNTGVSSSKKIPIHIPGNDVSKKGKLTDGAPKSPKRRKVLKTRIDERGREVTEVVWEGEETEMKKTDTSMTKNADNNGTTNTVNRPPVVKKSPAVGSTASSNPPGKAGNKKAGNTKDPKQGNILSFFKKV